ncbi:MAG: SpoIID/LytB domain-containing protein [Elusimicrobia bacterium]|nr:SpoIID/LytB domain-containing protein [Elusimicrobiota bacterium]
MELGTWNSFGAQEIRVLIDHIDSKEFPLDVPETGFLVTKENGDVLLNESGALAVSEGLIFNANGDQKLHWRGTPYRGLLEVVKAPDGRLALVNALELEDYLLGVLPSEMDTKTWPMEALKAQAVISRSYAISMIEANPKAVYHVGSRANHQMYFGATYEDDRARQAVEETRGEVIRDDRGAVLAGYFHSCCGGRTEDARQIWSQSASEKLVGVSDFGSCKISPHYAWVTSLPVEELERALVELGFAFDKPIRGFLVGRLTQSSRVVSLKVITNSGRLEVPTDKLRQVLGPNWIRSTRITDIKFKNGRYLIYGRGWGHGVGLCQWGAYSLALKKGWDYQRIVRHYFPKSSLNRM